MNLIIDIGNTSTKLAVFDGPRKLQISRINELSSAELEIALSDMDISKAIISSVRKIPPFVVDLLSSTIPYVHLLSHQTKLPFKIDYETPETLGTDRIAGAAGAFSIFPGEKMLLIDAGSAITYDLISDGIYKGGNISPGLTMRLRALNTFTGRLPLIDLTDIYTNPGQNTRDAILAGVITGVTYEINEYIRTFKKQSTDFKIILTGGDSGFLKDKINSQFTYMPDIVIDGLNYILEYNAA